jgi:Sensors of blue-light using FAD
MTYRIIYSSQATADMSVEALEEILVDARAGNEARGITGALVYVDGVFLQILEGDKGTVLDLMHNIAGDARHSSVTVFHEAEVDQPLFSGWRMAYLSAAPEQLAVWAGLEGTATLDDILASVRDRPGRAAHVATGILEALAG